VFYPDGKRVLTAGGDMSARVYIVDFGDLLAWAEKQLPKEVGP
jgi:hypothetical protein